MRIAVIVSILATLASAILSCSEHKKSDESADAAAHYVISTRYNENNLKTELLDTAHHNLVNKLVVIKDFKTAIEVAEPILFNIYSKENIIRQRPYEIQKVGVYYVINGTLPKGSLGGIFSIVIDSRDSRIVGLTHGK